jgi:hypothetical protein
MQMALPFQASSYDLRLPPPLVFVLVLALALSTVAPMQ